MGKDFLIRKGQIRTAVLSVWEHGNVIPGAAAVAVRIEDAIGIHRANEGDADIGSKYLAAEYLLAFHGNCGVKDEGCCSCGLGRRPRCRHHQSLSHTPPGSSIL